MLCFCTFSNLFVFLVFFEKCQKQFTCPLFDKLLFGPLRRGPDGAFKGPRPGGPGGALRAPRPSGPDGALRAPRPRGLDGALRAPCPGLEAPPQGIPP